LEHAMKSQTHDLRLLLPGHGDYRSAVVLHAGIDAYKKRQEAT
jgi:hypothetical protein